METPDDPNEVTPRKNDGPSMGMIALVCGVSMNFVLYYGNEIYLDTHNAGAPPAWLFLLGIVAWSGGWIGMQSGGREKILSIIGIIFALPGTLVFLWFVFVKVLPFYVNVICGGPPL